MEKEMAMANLRRNAPDADLYLDDNNRSLRADEMFEDEKEDEIPERSSVIQVGWSAAKKIADSAGSEYTKDFKFEAEVQLIKFLSAEPMAFSQHWVERKGKKSFICTGGKSCPLCMRGNRPESKFAFSVVSLLDDEPQTQLMVVGVRLYGQLDKLNSDPKNGPLDRLYWAVSKSGKDQKTSYSILPVKERDLAEDWDIDVEAADKLIGRLAALGVDALRIPSDNELRDIAREISDED
jgi:hypothetical protein